MVVTTLYGHLFHSIRDIVWYVASKYVSYASQRLGCEHSLVGLLAHGALSSVVSRRECFLLWFFYTA